MAHGDRKKKGDKKVRFKKPKIVTFDEYYEDYRWLKFALTVLALAAAIAACVYAIQYLLEVFANYQNQQYALRRQAVEAFNQHDAAHLAVAWSLPMLGLPAVFPQLDEPGDRCSWSKDQRLRGRIYEIKEYHFSAAVASLAGWAADVALNSGERSVRADQAEAKRHAAAIIEQCFKENASKRSPPMPALYARILNITEAAGMASRALLTADMLAKVEILAGLLNETHSLTFDSLKSILGDRSLSLHFDVERFCQ